MQLFEFQLQDADYNLVSLLPELLTEKMGSNKLCSNSMEKICEEFSQKTSLKPLENDLKDAETKIKQLLIRIFKNGKQWKRLDLPQEVVEIFQKQSTSVKTADHDEDLVERSPMRSPLRSPEHHQSYQHPYLTAPLNGVQRGQETDDALSDAILKLLRDANQLQSLTNWAENILQHGSDGQLTLDETANVSHHNDYVSNGSYQNMLNDLETQQHQQWEAARSHIHSSGPRSTRYSFSSTASSASSASPDPALLSPPSSPESYATNPYDSGVAEITDAWISTSVSHSSPTHYAAYANVPAPVIDLQTSFMSSSSDQSDSDSSPPPTVPYLHKEACTPMKDRLSALLVPAKKEAAWALIQQLRLEKLTTGDADGDMQLMILLANKKEFKEYKEYLYNIVERLLKEKPSALALCNRQGRDALHIAVRDCPEEPLLAAYVAEAYIRGGLQFKEYEGSESLIHVLVRLGDSYEKVLKELLQVTLPDGSSAFNVNKLNTRGLTPLHLACACHRPGELDTSAIVQTLLNAGADILAQEYLNKNTPLHVLVENSGDVHLLAVIRNLLSKRGDPVTAAEAANRQSNTVMHVACAKNSLPLEHHKRLVEVLLTYGGRIHLKNNNGYVPSYLVDPTRKEEIRVILHSKTQTTNSDLPELKSTTRKSPVPSFASPSSYSLGLTRVII